MFNRQLKRNIKELDLKISRLSKELDELKEGDSGYEVKLKILEGLTRVRCQLAESMLTESKRSESYKSELISGILGLSAVLLVLNYEKTDVITSKALGITKLFRGI